MGDEAIIIPIVALTIPIVVVPTALLFKHLRDSRRMLHAERMRAIERGQPFSAQSFWPSLAAISIGGLVPVGCFLVAWLASLTDAAGEEVFVGATILGIVAVVTGARLATKLLGSQQLKTVADAPLLSRLLEPEAGELRPRLVRRGEPAGMTETANQPSPTNS